MVSFLSLLFNLWRSVVAPDLEPTFRFFKQTLGWTAPKVRNPHAADRWTWIVITAYTQLRLARYLAQDLHRHWERPAPEGRFTPARVRRGFGTYVRRPHDQPVHRNPPHPVPDAHPGHETVDPPPATTSARPPNGHSASKNTNGAQVEQQA